MTRFCSLYSGSSGNCLYLEHKNTKILIDAGMSGKKIEESLSRINVSAEDLDAILITHEHYDHVLGLGVMSRRYHIPAYATRGTWDAIGDTRGVITSRNIPIPDKEGKFYIKELAISLCPIPHDATAPVAYTFYTGSRKISIATDIGHITGVMRDHILGSDLVLLESNYDQEMLLNGSYSFELKSRIMGENGHLSNDNAAQFIYELINAGTTEIILGHLSGENNEPRLALSTTTCFLREKGIPSSSANISVAYRDRAGSVVTL